MGLGRVNCMWAAITMTLGPHADGQVASKNENDAPALIVCLCRGPCSWALRTSPPSLSRGYQFQFHNTIADCIKAGFRGYRDNLDEDI